MAADFRIIKNVFVLPGNKEMKKEMNIISWNGRYPVYDLRLWSEDHSKMGKGCTFTTDELKALKDEISKMEVKDIYE